MADRDSNNANFFQTTLTSSMGATDLTATVDTTTGGPASPCYLIVEPDDVTQREVIFFNGTFTSTTFVTGSLGNRYLTGSAAGSGLTHPSGSIVESRPLAQHLEDLHDRVDAGAAAYEAAGAVTTHEGAGDPHVGYVLEAATDASGFGFVVDEDDMVSDSALLVPSQQSVKAYVDTGLAATGSGASVADSDYTTRSGGASSTTEFFLNLATIPESEPQAGDVYRVRAWGSFYADGSGGPGFRLRLGTTTVLSMGAGGNQLAGGEHQWLGEFDVVFTGTAAEVVTGQVHLSTGSISTWEYIDGSTAKPIILNGFSVATEDSTAGPLDLDFGAIFTTSVAAHDLTIEGSYMERIAA